MVNRPGRSRVAACDYQAYGSKLKKLNKISAATDEYIRRLTGNVEFIERAMQKGLFLHHFEMLARRHREQAATSSRHRRRLDAISEEAAAVRQARVLVKPCGSCVACLDKKVSILRRDNGEFQ